jgi:phosphatidate cytidylyltransferase
LIVTSNKQSLKQTLRDFGGTAFVLVYLPLLLSFSIQLVTEPLGVQWVLGLVLSVAIIDTFGYLIGRFFGKTKLSPEISPKKTWEGLVASFVGAFVGGQILVLLIPASFLFGLLFGAAILLSSVLGDLSESLIKRDLNVKDMGNVLPGHGGVLDRIDSLIPSSFVAYLMSQLVF